MFEPITKYMCLNLLDYQKDLRSNLLFVFPEPTVYQKKKITQNLDYMSFWE
uniref:Uncharacterized protein n=1 Tax=Uncultured archaeon GZfos26G2 TaxID=3386331 RepID=Q649G4_UNCAG|nr:hypothetical protein GZ35A2_38 [uncultured archaeon GZfos35A2]